MKLIYCDYIANLIQTTLNLETKFGIDAGDPKPDLDPEFGHMVSYKKVIKVIDKNGTRYTVTIEEDKTPEAGSGADAELESLCGVCDSTNISTYDTEITDSRYNCNDCGNKYD